MTGNKSIINSPVYVHDPVVHNFTAARQVLPFILQLRQINSILDVGCGTGTWLAVAKELGVTEIVGVDTVKLDQADLKVPSANIINTDLTLPFSLNKRFDLVTCLEVAEHLPEHAAKTLINTLVQHSDFILFSAALPGQGGQNHLNEQWPDYWQNLFEAQGYFPNTIIKDEFWDNEKVNWWYRQNIVLFGTKDILAALNLAISKTIPAVIHPALFKEKLNKIDELVTFIDNQVWKPSIKTGLRTFLRSLIK